MLGGVFFKLMLTAFSFWAAGKCKPFKVADVGWIASRRSFLSRDRSGGGVIKSMWRRRRAVSKQRALEMAFMIVNLVK